MYRIHGHIIRVPRLIRFAFVGATCAVVQLACLSGLVTLGVEKQVANIIAIVLSTEINVFLSRQITWRDRHVAGLPAHTVWRALVTHHALLASTLVINEAVFALVSHRLPYLMAGVCGITAAAITNYVGSNRMIFRLAPAPPHHATPNARKEVYWTPRVTATRPHGHGD